METLLLAFSSSGVYEFGGKGVPDLRPFTGCLCSGFCRLSETP